MTLSRRWMLVLVLLLAIVALDQATKWVAQETLHPAKLGQARLEFPKEGPLKGTFWLTYARNKGAFLSLFANLPESVRVWVLLGINGVILAVLAGFLAFKRDVTALAVTALSLILGGGVGNLLDRLFREGHEVVDYMNLGIGRLRTGIFNVADLAIMAGLGLLILAEFHQAWNARKHPAPASTEGKED